MSFYDAGRKTADRAHGVLARIIAEALAFRDKMRADGASEQDIAQGLERTIRQHWPQGREWHYLCDACQDTGLVLLECRAGHRCNGVSTRTDTWKDAPGKYRRLCTIDPSYTHSYGAPCSCEKGSQFRPKVRGETDALAAIAKTTSEFKRFGR